MELIEHLAINPLDSDVREGSTPFLDTNKITKLRLEVVKNYYKEL